LGVDDIRFLKRRLTPSPLQGEGWGEGANSLKKINKVLFI